MKDLIEALGIFLKYADERCPTHCEHDVLRIMGIPRDVAPEDARRLKELGFLWTDEDDGAWISFRFGSA